MSRLFAPIQKELCRVINVVIDTLGVQAEVFYPLEERSSYSASNTYSISYPEAPNYIGLVFIREMFGSNIFQYDFIDELLMENNNRLFTRCDAPLFPNHSKVVLRSFLQGSDGEIDYPQRSSQYKIEQKMEYRFNGVPLLVYYEVSPIITRDTLPNTNEIPIYSKPISTSEGIDKEFVDGLFEEEDADKLLNQRHISKFFLKDDD